MNQTSLFDASLRAEAAAKNRFSIGKQEKINLLNRVATMVIRDKLVAPTAMYFSAEDGDTTIFMRYLSEDKKYRIHRHALSQLAAKVDFPMIFLNRLKDSSEDWRRDLLVDNLNTLFSNTSFRGDAPKFLHRLVGDELRGFLSRRFNRHLASLPMLRAFVDAYERAGAQPVEAITSDTRLSLKAYLPHTFEAFPGQYICVGVDWSNSDFGAGKLMISQTIWDPCRNTGVVVDESISRVHLGSIIEESDIEMSEETMAKEVEAQASAILDTVTQQLSEKSIDKMLRAVKVAHEEQIPFGKLKGMLKVFLLKKEVESIESLLNSSEVVDLPPVGKGIDGTPLPTRWWASTVVAHFANKTEDVDRKVELQREAGKLFAASMMKEED